MFTEPIDDRVVLWRNFREELKQVDESTALKQTAELWSKAPFMSHYLTPDQPEEWPDPWELLTDNLYCNIAIALGMCYTLGLAGFAPDQLFLKIHVQDNLNLVFYKNNILNYESGIPINTSQLLKTNFQYVYNYIDLRIGNYV